MVLKKKINAKTQRRKEEDRSINLFALHGFLGKPSDWDFLNFDDSINLHAIDIYSIAKPQDGLWIWAKNFNGGASLVKSPRILMGYSLGGRLALHALLQSPQLWHGALIISAYPGGLSEEEKILRCKSDERWADRFATEAWESIMKDWNDQETFRSSASPVRDEKDYDRKLLSVTLVHWSSGKQDNLISVLRGIELPILWMAGENDKKFSVIAKSLVLSNPLSKIWIAPDAGHRLPWDNSKKFQIQVDHFLNKIRHGEYS